MVTLKIRQQYKISKNYENYFQQSKADHYDLLVCNGKENLNLDEYQLIRDVSQKIYLPYLVSDHRIELLIDSCQDGGNYTFEYLCQIVQDQAVTNQRLPIHSVLLEYQGAGMIIFADSGVRKSMHARLWRDYEQALILNGDRSFIHKEDHKWIVVGYPWCGSSVDIKAIVLLKRGTGNKVYPLSVQEALPQLLKQI